MPESTSNNEALASIRQGGTGAPSMNISEIFNNPWAKGFAKLFFIIMLLTAAWIFFSKAGATALIVGVVVLVLGTFVWWFRRRPSYLRLGGRTVGSVLTGQAKLIMWLVFHAAFWSVAARFAGAEYVGEWWWGKYSLLFYPMHLIYICRGVLPGNITGQLRFGNVITMVALGALFGFMLFEVGFCISGRPLMYDRILGSSGPASASQMIPGNHQAISDELLPGAYSVWMVPEGRDSTGAMRRMEVGVLPAGTKWIQIFKVGGRVYTDKLIYTFAKGKLEVKDEIRTDYALPSPDTDGDGYLTINQSPLWLVLANGLGGWRLVHPDKFELAAPLAADTPLYVLIKSDQAKSGTGVINLEIRSGV
jgi:hypothetical protein